MIDKKCNGVVYEGAVTHRRFKPVTHRLKYNVFSFLLDLEGLDRFSSGLRFFSRNKFNLFSFLDRDFGGGGKEDVAVYIRNVLRDAGIDAGGRILLLCYPRMLGYAFNPLSVYYCYDGNDRLAAMIYEVRNTFGGKHSYLMPVKENAEQINQATAKLFHVSPFIDMNMRYHFSLSRPGDDISVFIQTADQEGPLLNAAFTGDGSQITDRKLISLFFRYPLMTFKVIFGIHWEAIKLLAKGLRLRPGAPTPKTPVTLVTETSDHLPKAA